MFKHQKQYLFYGLIDSQRN